MKQITLFVITILICNTTLSQNLISGSVSDHIGPLAGTNVIIKNTTQGTTTDLDGQFKLEVKATDTLLISYMGFTTKEVAVNNQSSFKIILDGAIELDEVVLIFDSYISICRTISCGFNRTNVYFDDRLPKSSVKLFPNPSKNGIFQLNLMDSYKDVEINVSTITGQTIMKSKYQNINKNVVIDLSAFPSGIYLINSIVDGKRLDTKKAIRN